MNIPGRDERAIILDEASRQLELAVHDSQVAFDCIALGNLDRAHTHAITARAAADAAETALRAALGGDVLGGDVPRGDPLQYDPLRADPPGGDGTVEARLGP